MLKIENAYWFRIRVGSNRRRKIPPSITYVVHFPNTRYLVIAGLKSASAKFLLQVAVTFSYIILDITTLCILKRAFY